MFMKYELNDNIKKSINDFENEVKKVEAKLQNIEEVKEKLTQAEIIISVLKKDLGVED